MNDVLINAKNVRLRHEACLASAPVSFDILAGNIYGFIGPDSSLISAWLQTLAAIEPPTSGTVLFMGENTTHPDRNTWQKIRTRLAYLNHQSALLSVLSTQENILLPSLYHQLASREVLLNEMTALLEKINFADPSYLAKLPAYIDEVSYCQAMLIRTVLTKPRVIVIDNTLRHFNDRTSARMLAFLKDYLATNQASLLLQDDDPDFILKNASKIVFVSADCLLQANNRHELQATGNIHVLQYLQELATQ